MSDERINSITAFDYIITPELNYISDKVRVKFNGSHLKQDKIGYTHKTIVNIYIVYEITKNNLVRSYPTLENCLFGEIKLTKNPDIDKNKYSGYGIGFHRKGKFSFGNGFEHNAIILGVDISSFVHANSRTKNILILGEGITQGLDDTTLTAEKKIFNRFY